jgi:hypothetical protein
MNSEHQRDQIPRHKSTMKKMKNTNNMTNNRKVNLLKSPQKMRTVKKLLAKKMEILQFKTKYHKKKQKFHNFKQQIFIN